MNDAQRAAVFARDKGICSFSGLSVWYLDYGTAPFSHADWVDHIKPKSRGGKDTLDNLVCASHFYNRKKLNNGADSLYLFSGGKPTNTFFETHGELSSEQALLLKRHSKIEESDWYFNRAIFNVTVAIYDELENVKAVRTREYWLNSARKRMQTWRALSGGDVDTFARRKLVKYPNAEDIQLMISLGVASDREWSSIYRRLLQLTRQNVKLFDSFQRLACKSDRLDLISKAVRLEHGTEPLIRVLKKNAQLLPSS